MLSEVISKECQNAGPLCRDLVLREALQLGTLASAGGRVAAAVVSAPHLPGLLSRPLTDLHTGAREGPFISALTMFGKGKPGKGMRQFYFVLFFNTSPPIFQKTIKFLPGVITIDTATRRLWLRLFSDLGSGTVCELGSGPCPQSAAGGQRW